MIFMDAGIAVSLEPNDRRNLRDLFKAVVLNDGYAAGSLMVERARYEWCTSVPGGKHAFASGVGEIVSEFHDRRKQGTILNFYKYHIRCIAPQRLFVFDALAYLL